MSRWPTIVCSVSIRPSSQCGVGAITVKVLFLACSVAAFFVWYSNIARLGPIETSYHELM